MSRDALARQPQRADWLVGSVDLACIFDGVLHGPTGLDAIELGHQANQLGLRAVVLSAADHCTASIASYLGDADFKNAPIRLFGSVTLNSPVGGLNVYAVEHALMLSGRLVSMPTTSAENFLRAHRWPAAGNDAGPAINVVTPRGDARPELDEMLQVIADRAGILAGGCLHVSEVIALFRAASGLGVKRLLVIDPMANNAARPGDVDALLELGAHVMVSPSAGAADHALAHCLASSHPGQLILGLHGGKAATDLRSNYLAALDCWTALGLTEAEVRRGIAENPGRLLGLVPEEEAGA